MLCCHDNSHKVFDTEAQRKSPDMSSYVALSLRCVQVLDRLSAASDELQPVCDSSETKLEDESEQVDDSEGNKSINVWTKVTDRHSEIMMKPRPR